MVSIAKYAIPIAGLLIFGLFIREASASSLGQAGRSFGSGVSGIAEGIGGFGDSINKLGSGIGSGILGVLNPIKEVGSWFGLIGNGANTTANSTATQSGATTPKFVKQ